MAEAAAANKNKGSVCPPHASGMSPPSVLHGHREQPFKHNTQLNSMVFEHNIKTRELWKHYQCPLKFITSILVTESSSWELSHHGFSFLTKFVLTEGRQMQTRVCMNQLHSLLISCKISFNLALARSIWMRKIWFPSAKTGINICLLHEQTGDLEKLSSGFFFNCIFLVVVKPKLQHAWNIWNLKSSSKKHLKCTQLGLLLLLFLIFSSILHLCSVCLQWLSWQMKFWLLIKLKIADILWQWSLSPSYITTNSNCALLSLLSYLWAQWHTAQQLTWTNECLLLHIKREEKKRVEIC